MKRIKQLVIALIALGVIMVSGWIVKTKVSGESASIAAVRYETFDWPGDTDIKEITVTYTAADSTTKIEKYLSLGTALEALERHGWKLVSSGSTVVLKTTNRSAPGVRVFASANDPLRPRVK